MSMYDERIAKLKKQQNENSQSLKTSQAGSMYDERIAAIKASENPSAKANADIISLFSEKYREDQQKRTENAKRFQEERQEFKSRHGSNVDLMKFDLDAGQKEIDKLVAELARLRTEKNAKALDFSSRPYAAGQVAEDAQYTTGYGITNNRPYAAGQQAQRENIPTDDRIRELEMQIAQKKQYFNQAKHYQETIAYDDTVKNADFDKYDDYAESDDTLYNWINNPQFRESYEASYQSIPNPNARRSKYIRKGYDRMSASEIAIYNYYYAKSGKEAAQKYLDTIQERLNERTAEEMYSAVQDDVAAELVFGVSAGLNQFGSNVANNFRFKDDYIAKSAHQIASEMVREDLADNGPKLPKVLGGASLGQIAYDAITTTANMAPSILASYAVAAAAGTLGLSAKAARTVGSYAGNTAMGLSAAGGAYQQALNEGYDKNQARGYSILVGASEMAMEKLLGGISAVGGNALGFNAVKNIANADKALLAIAKRVGGSALSEFGEEYLQEVLDPVFSNIMLKTDKEVKPISAEALYSGILGMLTGAFMEAPSAIYGEAQTASTGRKLKEAGGVDSLAKIGNTFAADTVAYKLAGKVNENTGAYTLGRLFNEIGATLTEQNVSEITDALIATGRDEITAKKNAQALARVIEGEKLTDRQIAMIEADDVLAETARTTLIDSNTTWNQRTQGYNEVLRKLAMDKVTGKKSAKAALANDQQMTGKSTAEESTAVEKADENRVETVAAPKVSKIQTIEKGKTTVKLDDGAEVDLKDAALDPEDSVRIETIANVDGMTAEDASIIYSILKTADGKSAQMDALGAKEAYQYGYYGLPESQLTEHAAFANSLTETQRKAVYEIGQKARQKKVENTTFKKSGAPKVAGKVHFDGDRSALNERQQVSLKTMDRIAEVLGVQIYVFESKVGRNGKRIGENGWYDPKDGSIHIDLYAGATGESTMLFTLAHELTHYIRQWSPQKFKVLADFLMEEYGKKGVRIESLIREQQAKAKRNGRTISYDTAYEEVVADSMEMMLSDGNVMKRLEKLKVKDKDLWSQIKRFVDNMAAKIREVYKGLKPDSKEAELVMEMGDTIYRLQELFAEGLVEASENFQTAEKNTTEDGGADRSAAIKRSERIVDQIRGSLDKIMALDGVYVINSSNASPYVGIHKDDETIGRLVFKGQGGFANRSGFGKVVLGRKGVVSTVFHGNGPAKQAAFPAIKAVIENGIEIGHDFNHKDRGYDTVTFAAPIDFFDTKSPLGVVVQVFDNGRGDKSFYIHEICDAEGNYIELVDGATQKKIISSTGSVDSSSTAGTADDGISPKNSIRDDAEKVNEKTAESVDISFDEASESVAPSVLYSERTWTESDYVQERDAAAKEIAKAIGVTEKKAKDYIDSVNSIAKMIADDRTRLDYFSSPNRSSFVSNVEYGGSFDFSTLCKKRRLLTGTFTAIQKALPNTALTANEILDIRNRMKDAGLEVSCGLCYVEGSRANMGQFAKEFLRLYKQYYPDAWQPNMADVNTPDGIEWVRINHPECYEQYEYFWNHYGTLKAGDKNLFASQQKPKLYQLHTEYRGEILKKFKDDDNVEEKNLNGGIRLQSFSDFEIVHLIDTMQIIMDMSRVGLAGQAYTKVPDFAWALGDTGLKINLSLIAKGVDENGKLIFDDVEGMPIKDAMNLRDRYSKNVGTILVAFNDEQLKAAMADARVDFIIPFHRSQWKKSQYSAMGLPAKTKDYTFMQNEKFIKPQYHEYRGRMVKDKATNYMPNEYWDFSKSGKENAEAYLQMCARNNKRPKFYKLLQDNGDGSYSLKADGSTDGYWKLLIDFKMYDNAGNGSPQQAVKPEFNMDEATRMLNDYSGGHSNFPVAQGIVDEFVSEYKDSHKGVLLSDRDTESVSNRSMLANAMESLAQTELEKKKLNEYKAKIDQINAEEQKLSEVRAQIKELSFAKGPRDKEKLRALRDEAIKLSHHIGIYDKQLLRLEASKPLQNVLDREKAKAYQRGKEKGEAALKEYKQKAMTEQEQMKKRYEESRKRSVENRNKTAMRHKIRKTIRELDKLLNRGSKERNVKEGMRDFVAEALASAEVLFVDDYSNEDIIRNGVGCDTEPWESKLIDETQVLMQRKKDLYIKSAAMHEVDDVIAGNTVSFDARQKEADKLDRKIAENMRQLSGVFARERARLDRHTVSSMLENLAKAYKSLGQSDDLYIRAATDEVVYQHLLSLSEQMYGATVKDMTLKQLKELDKAYTMVLTTVQNANKVFREGRAQQLSQIVRLVQSQIQSISASEKDPTAAKEKIAKWIRSFSWNELRPVDAFERLGSDSFTELFWDVIDAQGEYGKLVRECADMVTKARKTANYAKWDMKSATTFKTVDGKEFKLTLGDLMSVYAYSKREQAYDHMTEGGFTFDTGRTYKSKENGKTYVHKKLSSTYRISEENLNRIISSLTAEQRKYVDTMQKFLTEFAKHGNKASRTLYGIDLFTEENYFPLFSEQDFRNSTEQDLNNTQTMVSLKESGMTKQTKPGANNPIVLRAFDDVMLEHLDKMAKYATYVLPIENLQRVFNSVGKDGENNTSTKALISSVFGEEATTYFKNYITDLNGGKQATGAANPLADLFARSKATAVSANLSVVIQQPTSIIRAMNEIDLKYFIPLSTKGNAKNNGRLYDEMMKYAPVAVIKDMGGFDVGSSSGLKGYIGTEETAWDAEKARKAAQDFFGWGAMQMDRIGWTVIWIAVKRETLKKTGLQYGSQAYLEACGKRFTEVVTKTQVYDSVNSRSGFMRSKNDSLKYLTTYMGEPTVTAGMTYMSHLKLYRAIKSKNKAQIAKATREWIRTDAVLVITALVCGFAKSFVYAMRDDDEDESFMERWFKHFGSAIASDRSFLGLLPVFRDIISIANGYTIERPDLALISDLITASNKVVETISDEEKREKMTPQEWYDLAKNHVGAICNFMGAPAANIIRDVEGAIRFIGDLTDDIYPVEMKESFKRGFSGNEEPKRETLYEAIVADDTGRINALKKSYVDEDGKFNESAYSSAIRKALREYDPRIREAAQAYFDSDLDRYNEIFDDIFHEDHFEHNDIHAAIMSEVGELEKKNAPEEVVEESEEENRSLYSAESYFNALLAGNKKSANLAYDRLVEAELDEGYLSYEAENNVKSALASQIGSAYKDGKINRETALKLLKENTDKDETDVKKWDFEIKFGYPWSGRDRAYRKDVISESELTKAIMDIEGESQEAARAYIKFIELASDHSDLEISADDAADYYEFAQPAKISLEAYMEFKEKTSALTVDKDKNGQTINGSKKKKVMDLINAMSLSVHQKDALYYAAGYKESTIDEAPWH